jgi:hypothetical protein
MTRFELIVEWVDRAADDRSPVGILGARAAFPEAGMALVDYLEGRFVALEERLAIEHSPLWWELLLLLAETWLPEERDAFLTRVVLRGGTPGCYRWIAAFVKVAFSADEVEPSLLAGLESPDPMTRDNARVLAYYLLDDAYRLSDAGEAKRQALGAQAPSASL